MEKEYQYLPPFPAKEDVWTALEKENRPIVVYGMGNGADKLLLRFAERKIEVDDFFASDGFVRGHSYKGKTVLSYSQATEKYGNNFPVHRLSPPVAWCLSIICLANTLHSARYC